MWPSLRPSQRVTPMAVVDPQSVTSNTVSTGWVDASTFENFMALVEIGTMGSGGQVVATVNQATSSTGTGSKTLTTSLTFTATQAAGDASTQWPINVKQDDLDVNNGFRWINVSLVVSGAACLVACQLLGVDPRYGPADGLDPTSVQTAVGP